MRRLALVMLPACGLVGFVLYFVVLLPILFASQPHPTPQEPIYFDHNIHTQGAGIECAFCHRTASEGATAGYPELQQCMFCHVVVGQGQPEVEKVREAWAKQQPIDWERIHRMPDHVRFLHEAHVQKGIPCSTCHGDVSQMGQVVQVRTLNMGDCLSCHRQMGAPTECAVCHK